MISGIGTDIVAVERFQRFVDENNSSLLRRLFTSNELELCARRKERVSCLAARFAAKEAFLKALGIGLRDGITWHDMEVVLDSLGKPDLLLTGRAQELFAAQGLRHSFLSLSHDGGNAIAMVVLETL
jgi:holo-[acyl-carrier protein] synthase